MKLVSRNGSGYDGLKKGGPLNLEHILTGEDGQIPETVGKFVREDGLTL
jgi:hypothetical protein